MSRRFRMAWQAWVGGAIFALSLLLASSATAQCNYEISAIVTAPQCPFSGPPSLAGQGMNNHGDIVGRYGKCDASGDEAFYWSSKTGLITLPRPKGVTSAIAYDVNDHGIIVGWHCIGNGCNAGRGFVYDINKPGQFTYLEPLHGVGGSILRAINNSGLAVGSRSIGKPGQNPNPYNAVIWDTKTGEITDLGVMNGPNSQANDVDETGAYVVGWTGGDGATTGTQGFRWANGEITLTGLPFGGFLTVAHAVNSDGVAVGTTPIQNNSIFVQGWKWIEDEFIALPPLIAGESAGPADINDVSQIVGSTAIGAGIAQLWQHDLNVVIATMIVPPTPVRGAACVNDAGQILINTFSNGLNLSYLLTPLLTNRADLTLDCRVNVHDVLYLLSEWSMQDSRADLSEDGIVNVFDLLIVLGSWGP